MRLSVILTAVAAFAFGSGFALGQSTLTLLGSGTWYFNQNGISNIGTPDAEILLSNSTMGAWFHAIGNGPTGVAASRLTNDNQGPTLTFHKGRGDPDDSTAVQSGDTLGGINFKASTNSSGGQANGARIRTQVIAANPSTTDMESKVCISAAGPGSVTLTDIVCFSVEGGMTMANRTVIDKRGNVLSR